MKSATVKEDRPPLVERNPLGTNVAAVSIKLPPFWPSDPHVWFAQVEAQFATRHITQQRTMFDYVVSSLQLEVVTEVLASSSPRPKTHLTMPWSLSSSKGQQLQNNGAFNNSSTWRNSGTGSHHNSSDVSNNFWVTLPMDLTQNFYASYSCSACHPTPVWSLHRAAMMSVWKS